MAGAGGLVALLLDVTSDIGPGRRHRGRRRADDRLRAGRRHEGHHLGADHQGRAADHRRGDDDGDGCWPSSASTSPRCSAPRSPRSRVRPPRPSPTVTSSRRARSTARALTSQINFISLALALVLGTAGLPHVLMRFYTVPTAKEARRSVVWAIALIGAFYLFTLVLGYGAAALVGPDTHPRRGGRRRTRPRRCWRSNSAAWCCSASSRRWRSRRSSRWSPA